MKHYLDIFCRVARRLRPELKPHQLKPHAGSWIDSAALKVQKPSWTAATTPSGAGEAGIFFSAWIEPKGLKRKQVFYNIHALNLRSFSGHTLQSREFAAAFRTKFTRVSKDWPNVSVDYGPQTLMQGWIPLDEACLEKDAADLVRQFIPLSNMIDTLLAQRKHDPSP